MGIEKHLAVRYLRKAIKCFPSANVVKKIVRTNTIVIVLVADLIKEFIYHFDTVAQSAVQTKHGWMTL